MSSAHVLLAENDPEFHLYTNIFCIVLSTTLYYQNQILHSILMFQILLLLLVRSDDDARDHAGA